MSDKKSNLLVPVIGAVIVAAGGVGTYLYLQTSPPRIASEALGTAKIVPQKALMAASISMDAAAWGQLEQFQTPETKKIFDDAIKKIQGQAFKDSDIDFEKDIKPWAGSVMFAILPADNSKQSGAIRQPRLLPVANYGSGKLAQIEKEPEKDSIKEPEKDSIKEPVKVSTKEPNVLLVVEIKDKTSASQFAEKVKAKAGSKFQQKEYKGVQISQFESGSRPTLTALVGDHLVISPQSASIEKAIDTFKGEASLASSISPGDLELKTPLVQFYVPNFPDAVQQIAALNANSSEIPPQTLEQLKQVKSMTIGIGVDGDGIRLKGLTKFDPNLIKVEYKPSPGKVISQFPSETLGLITGFSIKSRWEQILQSAESNPDQKKAIEQMRQSVKESPLALDLDKDIFGWMDGEFAIGAIASDRGILKQVGAGPAVLVQTSNRASAEATLKKLDDFIQSNGGTVQAKDVKGVSVTEWSAPGAPGPIAGHGWYDKDALFFTVASLSELIATKPANSLDSDPTFQAITGRLDKNNIGYFYLDMDKTWALIESRLPESSKSEITPEVKAVLGAIRGIAATAAVPEKTTSKFELLLALKAKSAK